MGISKGSSSLLCLQYVELAPLGLVEASAKSCEQSEQNSKRCLLKDSAVTLLGYVLLGWKQCDSMHCSSCIRGSCSLSKNVKGLALLGPV